MFWTVIERLGLLLGTALAGKEVMEWFSDIKPNLVYSPEEIATLLQMEKADVIDMIHMGTIKALRSHGQYRILGKNVIKALSQLDDREEDREFYAKPLMPEQRQN